MFYCGDHLLAFDSLVVAADFTRLPYSNLNSNPGARHWKMYLDWHHTLAEFIRRREQGEDVKFGLPELLYRTATLEATRPEDKVHALYGCAKRLGVNLPIPDCTKSVAQVYTEAMLASIQQAGNFKLLDMVEGAAAAELGLPSWVPNFSGSLRTYTPTNPPKASMPSKANKLVSGVSQCQWTIMPGGKRLKVLGRRLDQVAAVGEPWKADSRTTLLGGAATNTGEIYVSFLDCLPTWLDVVLQRNHRDGHRPTAGDEIAAMQDLTNLLINGYGLPGEPPHRIAESLLVLVKCASGNNEAFRSYPENNIIQIFEYLTRVIWKLVFRTTSKAYLGMGSYSSRPGDLVVVLHGMTLPCLIRPCAEGYNFVGAAFVDGIMEGEFWNAGSDADDEWFVLI
jgi:hypothetical protein